MTHDIEAVENIIKRSGNTFHCEVLSYLKKEGWTVLISPYYNDNISDKPREIDLIAEKAFPATRLSGTTAYGTINIKLFIECKYVSTKNVFWFHSKDTAKAEELVVSAIPDLDRNSNLKRHHYCIPNNDSVGKLFAGEKDSRTENEIFYKAINQSLNATVYYRLSRSIIPPQPSKIKITVNYPVIICNDFSNLYKIDIDSRDKPENITDNFQLEMNYAYIDFKRNQQSEYFLIDVVNFKKISTFLSTIQSDVDAINTVIS